MTSAIILFSHGSVLCGAGEALERHAARLRDLGLADIVEIGYLNYSEPLFSEAVDECVRLGTDAIVVAPYFLVPGYFVNVDLPKCLAAAQDAHPDVAFIPAEPIGFDARLADALIETANRPLNRFQWRDDLLEAARHCRSNVNCPLYGTANCPAGKEGHVLTQPVCVQTYGKVRNGPPPALLVMAHGTPNPTANAEMYRVVEEIRERAAFPIVAAGFLDCNQPSIPEAIDQCVGLGAQSIVAVPYFLHPGMHVADDLPTLIEEAERRHPAVSFAMGSYLGQAGQLSEILADRIQVARDRYSDARNPPSPRA